MRIFVTLLLLFLILKTETGRCADTTNARFRKNIVYVELGGKGPYYSVNYEHIFRQGRKWIYSYRAGFSLLAHDFSVPLAVCMFTNAPKHHLEFSLGITPYIEKYKTFLHEDDLSDKKVYITPGIGYRYQKRSAGLFFTAGVSPLIYMDPPSDDFWNFTPEFKPSAHVAIGVSL